MTTAFQAVYPGSNPGQRILFISNYILIYTIKFPNPKQALELLKEYPVPANVFKHCEKVKHNAVKIANQLIKRGIQINLGLIKSAALLHDIGRHKYSIENGYSVEESIMHIYETHRLLYSLGYRKFAKICASHSLGGFTRKECKILFNKNIELIPRTIEAKIINISDKLGKEGNTLKEIIHFYTSNKKYQIRFYKKYPQIKSLTIKRLKLSGMIYFENKIDCLPI